MSSKAVLYFREAPHDSYLVFATPKRAIFVDKIRRALSESKTWGEFRQKMPASEYQRTFADIFSDDPEEWEEYTDAREPADDEAFSPESVPGFEEGDYPPWLAAQQDRILPPEIIDEFGEMKDTFLNGSFLHLDAAAADQIAAKLVELGYEVHRREDLKFW